MMIHNKDWRGPDSILIDRGTGKAIRFAISYDPDTGEWEAFQVASNGVSIACDERMRPMTHRGKAVGKLELVPLNGAPELVKGPERVIEPMTIQQREQGIEDYRKLHREVWHWRGEANRCVDERWLEFVQQSSFLDSLIIGKSRAVRVM